MHEKESVAEKKRNGLQLNKEKGRQNGKGEAKRAMEQKDLKFQVFFLLERSLSCRISRPCFLRINGKSMLIQGRGQARKHQRKILRIPTIRTALNDGFMRQYPSDTPAGPTSRGESFIDFTLPVIRTPLFSQRKIRKASATVFFKNFINSRTRTHYNKKERPILPLCDT